VTAVAPASVVVQPPFPEHGPPQPRNRELLSGLALSLTVVLGSKRALQTVPQLIPAGLPGVVPLPPSG
jgi:hypothetical protein